MKKSDIITTILSRTTQAYWRLERMEELYGEDSCEASEARYAWHELYQLCNALGLDWAYESRRRVSEN